MDPVTGKLKVCTAKSSSNEQRGNAAASGVVERAWEREEACGRREGFCGTRYVSRRAGASEGACPCGRAVRRYAVQQAPGAGGLARGACGEGLLPGAGEDRAATSHAMAALYPRP